MLPQQPIITPFGISVFGSAIVRVVPDVVVIKLSVSQLKPHPREAFEAVRKAAQQVQAYLSGAQIKDAGSSRISLKEEHRYINNESKFVGYRTSVEFRVILSDLSRVEAILAGVAGEVFHIEDINPDQLQGKEGHARTETPLDDAGQVKAFDPSSITVGGAVRVAYTIRSIAGP